MDKNIDIKAYVDESGNSGKNLIDKKQPFFSMGCVILNDSKLNDVKKYLDNIPNSFRDEHGEIKGNNIACYDQALALQIISEFIPEISEVFFFSVLEKRFMIAGQIVENFFDYVYNDKTDVSWTYKSKKKIKLANFFYDTLSDETLESIHIAFLAANSEQIKKTFNQIITEIKGIDYEFDLVSTMLGAEKHIESLAISLSGVNAKNSIAKGVPKHTINTPNVTTFFELIGRVEKFLEYNKQEAKLVFDNSEQYNKVFNELITKMIKALRKKVPISAQENFQAGFRYLIDYEVKESKDSLGLQLSDLLTSIINHVFSKIIYKQDDQLTKEDILLTSIVYFLTTESQSGYWTVSKTISQRIGRIVIKINELEKIK
ncbi:MAG: DUF3800 domain-containing protein [Tissierellia bacterium]|nr:DUF3800 domain-containing protein [Tissierellia bacterium]